MLQMNSLANIHAAYRDLTAWLEGNRSFLDSVGVALKTFGLIIAPLVLYFEYRQSVEVQAQARALEETRLFRQSDESKLMAKHAMLSIDNPYLEKRKIAARQALAAKDPSLCPYHTFELQEPDEPSAKKNVYSVLTRLDAIAICANTGVCSPKVLCDALGGRVHSYVSDECTVIEQLERQWHEALSKQIRRFLNKCDLVQQTFCEVAVAKSGKTVEQLLAGCLSAP